MRHIRVIGTVLCGLVLTAVVCQGQASVTLSPTSLTFAGQLPLLAQPPRQNRTHGTTHATNLAADDCSLQFQGSARKAVKLRTKDSGKDYKKVSNGDAISASDWLKLTCSLDGDVPSQIPATRLCPESKRRLSRSTVSWLLQSSRPPLTTTFTRRLRNHPSGKRRTWWLKCRRGPRTVMLVRSSGPW